MQRRNSEEFDHSAVEIDAENTLDALDDPILKTPNENPVYCNDHHIYDLTFVLTHLQTSDSSPMTRATPFRWVELPGLVRKYKEIADEYKTKKASWEQKIATAEAKIVQIENQLKEKIQCLEKKIKDQEQFIHKLTTESKSSLAILPIDTPVNIDQSFINKRFRETLIQNDMEGIAHYIEERKADVDAIFPNGDTPLIYTLKLRSQKPLQARSLIEILCSDYGANVNKRGQGGMTPLHIAAGCNDFWSVKFLLGRAASPTQFNDQGQTPLQLAIQIQKDKLDPQIKALLNPAPLMRTPFNLFVNVSEQGLQVSEKWSFDP